MTNRYPGKCTKCGQTVHPNTGTCERVNGKWVTTHTECPTGEAKAELPVNWSDIESRGNANVVSAPCCKCGKKVGIGDGFCAREAEGSIKWYTWHADCTPAPAAQIAAQAPAGRSYERAEISRMFDAAEDLRDYPGRYFPALTKAQNALKAWREAHPEEAAAEDAAREAAKAADKARREEDFRNSFIGRGLD